jgi:serine/threonine protein phosphatase PrpC
MDASVLRVEYAEVSLLGARNDNQDRAAIAAAPDSSLLVVLDGMGGHAHGALAAEVGCRAMMDAFGAISGPLLDPMGFMHRAMGRAHEAVAALGRDLPPDRRPRTTLAACYIQDSTAWFGHVGDSRVYLLRNALVQHRTRDHSHVELLIREGFITDSQVPTHPLRNYVESCLGGDDMLPEMTVGRCRAVQPGDVLLVCSDGFWVPLGDADIADGFSADRPLAGSLRQLAKRAVQRAGLSSDNTSAAALRLS